MHSLFSMGARRACWSWNRHLCNFCLVATVVSLYSWSASCVATAGWRKGACQVDSPFRHHVLGVHDLSLTEYFWKYIFITLISTWHWSPDDNIWNQGLCLYGLSVQQAVVHSLAFQVPYSCIYTIYFVMYWAHTALLGIALGCAFGFQDHTNSVWFRVAPPLFKPTGIMW